MASLPAALCLAILSFFLVTQASEIGWESEPCESPDWQAYGEEKCFALVTLNETNSSSLTYDEATAICESLHPEATLPSIGSDGEQAHIEDLVMSYGSIWIGAKLNMGKLLWQDEAHRSNFTNWSEYLRTPTHGNFCVLMDDDDGIFGRGNWTFQNCNKSFTLPVLCQKHQAWGLLKVRNVMYQLTDSIDKKLEQHQQQFLDDKVKLVEYEQEILSLRNEVQNQKNVSLGLSRQVGNLSISANAGIPVGFVYIQYRDQVEPRAIWPDFSWTEVTSNYAGEFFRAAGGNAGSFGDTQNMDFPRITSAQYHAASSYSSSISISYSGTSSVVRAGSYTGSQGGVAFSTVASELRPYNSAVKIWKRTG